MGQEMLSMMSWPSINELWLKEIIEFMIGFSLLEMTLETSLYKTLHKLIGMYLLTKLGLFFLWDQN